MTARALLALFIAALSASAWGLNPNQDIVVRVEKDGPRIAVDVDCPVDVPWAIVWEVLTDYDHMAQFISNLQYSGENFVTRIVEVDTRIHIVNVGRYTPNVWVPPLVGPALIEAETQKQFGEIRTEILRRTATSLSR